MGYQITKEHKKTLQDIFGVEAVTFKDAIEIDYAHDELKTVLSYPDALVKAKDALQIQALMTYAHAHEIPVTVRGSGTGLVGACVPVLGGILLDTTAMNRIIELDAVNMTLRVEPGVLLLDIAEYVEKQGFFYAPDPGEKTATIGGNIATNAGGMRAIKYGVTRDWVYGLNVVLPDGKRVNLGGKIVKNSTGYGLKDLIIGSEGTLGIIVEATLKLIPKPKRTISLLVPFDHRLQAIEAAPKIITGHVLPTAIEFLEKATLLYSEDFLGKKIPHNEYPAYLLLSYDGSSDAALAEDIETASALCIELGAKDVYTIDTDERKTSVWSARGAFLEAIKASTSHMDECDVVLPRSNIANYLDFVDALSQSLNLRIPYFGHVGDGNLHIYLCKDDLDDATWNQKSQQAFDAMYQKAAELEGLVSGEHGIGYAKKSYMKKHLGDTQHALMKGIKAVFDPKNILNPGKVI